MRKSSIKVPFVALALSFGCLSPSTVQAQTPGAPASNGGGIAGSSTSSATGINSATTQSPTTTFQMQNASSALQLTRPAVTQPLTPSSGLVQNHTPAIPSRSFGVPVNSQDLTRHAVTPNSLSTPNAVVPQQVNRSIVTPPAAMPTYKKSQALQQLQPQLFKPK